VGITALLLVGKRASRQSTNAKTAQNVSGSTIPSGSDPAIGSMAPGFSLKSVPDGQTVTLASLKGKAVLVNFWATWCGPCKIEMPWLIDLQKKYGPEGLQIVGITKEDTDEKAIASFMKKMGVNYTVVVGTPAVQDLYGGIDGLPTSFFLGRSGKVVQEIIGLDSESKLEDAIKKALAQGM
jgi:thiol-disulfide isomerase/thioredoxin